MREELAAAKSRVRARVAARFAALDAAEALRAAEAAARTLCDSALWSRCHRVALYAARADELPTGPLAEAARREGKRLLWPRVVGSGLELAGAERAELVEGRFGVPAPPAAHPAEPLGPDLLIVVPGRAFDRSGHRLGRGGGFYDRLLAEPAGALAVGFAFSWQLEPRVPRAAHDRPVDAVLTEAGLFAAEPV